MQWLVEQTLSRMEPRAVGHMFERLQVKSAGADPRIGEYALNYNNPQALCFLIDVFPDLQMLFSQFPRMGEIRFLDIGPAFGASAGLISQMHRSHFLGPKVSVEVLDITDEREAFIGLSYPLINFREGKIEDVAPDLTWDVTYCSNAIEHMSSPELFIERVLSKTTSFACFLAPFSELEPMSPGHVSRIAEDTFAKFEVIKMRVFESAAWPTTPEGLKRHQIFAVLRGRACP